MGAYTGMKAILPDLLAIARDLHYSEDLLALLRVEDNTFEQNYPDTYARLKSCRHNRDGRTMFEYGRDLIASWIFEDYLVQQLQSNGIDISLAGADRKRQILSTQKVSSSSDTKICYQGKERLMEIMTDYTGWWSRQHSIDLRDDKFERLKNTDSLFIGVSVTDNKFCILDFSKEIAAKYHSFYPPYRKPAYSVKITADVLEDFDLNHICNKIKQLI